MKTTAFDYHLPTNLIAEYPTKSRTQSKLLQLAANGSVNDYTFSAVLDILKAGDLLILNDTKVLNARIFGNKQTGGKVELLVERIIDGDTAWCMARANRALKPATTILFKNSTSATIITKQQALYKVKFNLDRPLLEWLAINGHLPLPPYMRRQDETLDHKRYQTVYSQHLGAVAAPTAGLHFDQELIAKIKAKGVNIAFVTLHIGAGTFKPVSVANIKEHQMHYERYNIKQPTIAAIIKAKQNAARIIATGTTVVRAVESLPRKLVLKDYSAETNIFITPGYKFKFIDGLISNFHLPKSTLLMLVCAFNKTEQVLNAYQYAIANNYRFYSYGDAMYIEKNNF